MDQSIWGAVGCHPKHATDYSPSVEEHLKEMVKHEKVVAVGEIGLDYSGR